MADLPRIPEVPVTEVFEIRNRGSYSIPPAARKAHRITLDVEVRSVTRTQYRNNQYNLPQGEYGNCTLFNGAAILNTIKIKYPTQRVIEWVNIEAGIQADTAINIQGVNETLKAIIEILVGNASANPNQPANSWGLPYTHAKFVLYPDTQISLICTWWPFVEFEGVATPEPDISDPQQGKDEYREPTKQNPSAPFNGNPPPSERQLDRDARDFNNPSISPVWKVWLVGTFLDGQGQYQQQSAEPPDSDQAAYLLTPIDPANQAPVNRGFLGNGPGNIPIYAYGYVDGRPFGGGWQQTPSLTARRWS